MLRIIQIVLILLMPSGLFAKTLVIGTLPFNPPFEVVTQNNHFLGLDIEVMQQVCRIIKTSCKFKAIDFDSIFQQIDSGEIDLGIGSIIISPSRAESYLLSTPYFPSSAQFFVKRNSPLTDISQLKAKKIATVEDWFFMAYLNDNYKTNTITIYKSIPPALLALSSKQIDAFFLDSLSANYWVLNSGDEFRALGEAINLGGGYTIIARKDQTALIQQINQGLLQMNQNGVDSKIFNNYM